MSFCTFCKLARTLAFKHVSVKHNDKILFSHSIVILTSCTSFSFHLRKHNCNHYIGKLCWSSCRFVKGTHLTGKKIFRSCSNSKFQRHRFLRTLVSESRCLRPNPLRIFRDLPRLVQEDRRRGGQAVLAG